MQATPNLPAPGDVPTLPAAPVAAQVLVDWWVAAGRARWFRSDPAFDAEFAQRFTPQHQAVVAGQSWHWLGHAHGALALLLLLDQFPRNVFRRSPQAFACDPLARQVAALARALQHDQAVEPALRIFFYLPWMHSEDMADQRLCLALHQAMGPEWTQHAQEHLDIIARFGRFPHRNGVLGRLTTAAEQAFLDGGGFAG